MFFHSKKSASILTNQDTQMVGNDQWLATICNAGHECNFSEKGQNKKNVKNGPNI